MHPKTTLSSLRAKFLEAKADVLELRANGAVADGPQTGVLRLEASLLRLEAVRLREASSRASLRKAKTEGLLRSWRERLMAAIRAFA